MNILLRLVSRTGFLSVVGVVLMVLVTIPAGVARVHAVGTLYVTPSGDDANDCLSPETPCRTIATALRRATTGDTINIAAGSYTESLQLSTSVTLSGAGAQTTVITAAAGRETLTSYDRGVTAQLTNLTLMGGRSGGGGGIANYGTLTVIDSRIRDNTTWIGEGIQGFGAGIYNAGSLTIINSSVSGNTAVGTPDYPERSGLGGGIYNRGTLTLTGSTVSGNTANRGGGIYNEGILSVMNSTISGNSAQLDGGGLFNSASGVITMNNATIAANTADSDNDGAGDGGGIAGASTSTTRVQNTLLGDNQDTGGQAAECAGTLTSLGHNLIESAAGCTVTGDWTGNVNGQDPHLGPLQDNGGPTWTQALLGDSAAVDAGAPATCYATDQRGVTRPQGSACDIGAYEYQVEAPITCPCSIWTDSAKPARDEDPDAAPVELGVKFRSNIDGYVTGLRFYKSAANTGEHIGNLWTGDGELLAQATFHNETETGWQKLDFATPVLIRANTTYVASYHTEVGHYSVDEGYFAGQSTINGPLEALADRQDDGNGVYRYGATGFPTETYNASNYWVDVVFETCLEHALLDLGTLGTD